MSSLCWAASRAGSSSDVNVFRREFSAGQTTRNCVFCVSASVLIVLEELLALDRLVRDDEDAALVGPPERLDVLPLRGWPALAQVDGDRGGRQAQPREEAERRRDPGCDRR